MSAPTIPDLEDQYYTQISLFYNRSRFIPNFLRIIRDLVDRRQYRLLEYFLARTPAHSRSDVFEICIGSRQEEILPLLSRIFKNFDYSVLLLYGVSERDTNATFYHKLLELYGDRRPKYNWPLLRICQLSNFSLMMEYLLASFSLGCEIGFSSRSGGSRVLKELLSHVADLDGTPDPRLEEIWSLLCQHEFYLESFTVPEGYIFLLLECYFKKPAWLNYLLAKFEIELTFEDITPLITLQIPELIEKLNVWNKVYEWVFTSTIDLDSFEISYTYTIEQRCDALDWLLENYPDKYTPVKLLNYLVSLTTIPSLLLDRLLRKFRPIHPMEYFTTYLHADLRSYYEMRDKARKLGNFILDDTPLLSDSFSYTLEEVVLSRRVDFCLRSVAADLQRLYAFSNPLRVWKLSDLHLAEWVVIYHVNRKSCTWSYSSLVRVTSREIKDDHCYLSLQGKRYWSLIQSMDRDEENLRYFANYYGGICPRNEIYFVEIDNRPTPDPANIILLRLGTPPSLRILSRIASGNLQLLDAPNYFGS